MRWTELRITKHCTAKLDHGKKEKVNVKQSKEGDRVWTYDKNTSTRKVLLKENGKKLLKNNKK